MNNDKIKYPLCFGILEKVFPKGKDGLRSSPDQCMGCDFKVECLRCAMKGREGLMVQEEIVDRAYSSGLISFFERWSKKKDLHRKIDDQALKKSETGKRKHTRDPQDL
jgi:hypothetical protein